LLVIIGIIAIIAAMLLPPTGGKRKAQQINCMLNLKEIDASFVEWSQSHDGKLPMQVSAKDGGSMDFIQSGSAAIHFLALTNSDQSFVHREIVTFEQNGTNCQKLNSYTNYGIEPRMLICPSDQNRFYTFDKKNISDVIDTNISYFVGVDATLNNPKSIFIGDRNLEVNGAPTKSGLLELTPKSSVGWTEELHYSKSSGDCGNILLADGHVEFLKSKTLNASFQSGTNRLAVP
jgi:prepilin-type processing-associated H-X9-DG protein